MGIRNRFIDERMTVHDMPAFGEVVRSAVLDTEAPMLRRIGNVALWPIVNQLNKALHGPDYRQYGTDEYILTNGGKFS